MIKFRSDRLHLLVPFEWKTFQADLYSKATGRAPHHPMNNWYTQQILPPTHFLSPKILWGLCFAINARVEMHKSAVHAGMRACVMAHTPFFYVLGLAPQADNSLLVVFTIDPDKL